jgi:hypothetical protein
MSAFEFFGESFELRAKVPQMAILEFADAAESQDGGPRQTAAMFRLIQACVSKSDWSRFRAAAMDNDATIEDLMPVVKAAMEQQAARPTGEPSGSSIGLVSIPQTSVSQLEPEATEVRPIRGDRALAVSRSA